MLGNVANEGLEWLGIDGILYCINNGVEDCASSRLVCVVDF